MCRRLPLALILALAAAAAARAESRGSRPAPKRAERSGPGQNIDQAIKRANPDVDPDDIVPLRLQVAQALKNMPEEPAAIVKYIQGYSDPAISGALRILVENHLIGQAGPAAPGRGGEPRGSGEPSLPSGWAVGISLAKSEWQRNPDDPGANARLGGMLYLQKSYRDAFQRLDDALRRGERDPVVLAQYAGAAYQLGDYPTAAEAARRALNADPENKDAQAIYQFSKDRAPAVNLPSSLGDLASDPSPAAAMPAANAEAGRSSPAMTAEQAAVAAHQAGGGGPSALARSQEFAKDAADAMRMRDYPTAYQLASQAVALNPQNAQAFNFRAMSLGQMRRYSEAARDASVALELAPGSLAALHTRSWAFSKEGKYKEGLQDAEEALGRDPRNPYLYQDQALALAGLGERPRVLDALRRSAALDPRFAGRLERALQLPQDADMTLLFDEGAPVVAVPAPAASRPGRFLRLAGLTALGGLLIALGILHIVSASWRDRVRMTVRRALGSRPAAAAAGAGASAADAFWMQYELVKEIGLGGMGVVYEALDRSLQRRVAIKKMRDEIRLDPAERGRFVDEARMVAQLHHPGIVDVYGIVEDGTDVYLVFEFVEGRTLEDALKSGGPMSFARARQAAREMAAAVSHAHARGIIHRDLKPSNVMLTPDGRVKVMDFGVARQAKEALTRRSMTNSVVGTPPYMSPEQEQGVVRKEADVYALGVCLYEMVTGGLPFSGTGAAMLLNKIEGKIIPAGSRAAGLPSGFDGVIARALAPDPDRRFHSPEELVAALDALS